MSPACQLSAGLLRLRKFLVLRLYLLLFHQCLDVGSQCCRIRLFHPGSIVCILRFFRRLWLRRVFCHRFLCQKRLDIGPQGKRIRVCLFGIAARNLRFRDSAIASCRICLFRLTYHRICLRFIYRPCLRLIYRLCLRCVYRLCLCSVYRICLRFICSLRRKLLRIWFYLIRALCQLCDAVPPEICLLRLQRFLRLRHTCCLRRTCRRKLFIHSRILGG